MLYDADLNDAWLLKRCFVNATGTSEHDFVMWKRAAKFFGARVSTVQRWYRENKMPYMARKLCLIKLGGTLSLHGNAWRGFTVVNDRLHTPLEGYSLTPNQISATWYLVNNMQDKPREWWDAMSAN